MILCVSPPTDPGFLMLDSRSWLLDSGPWILDARFSTRTPPRSSRLWRIGSPHHLIPRLPGLSESLSEIRLLEVLFQITIKIRCALHSDLSPATRPSLFILGKACTSSFREQSSGFDPLLASSKCQPTAHAHVQQVAGTLQFCCDNLLVREDCPIF
jgi:hypothetical protein